MENLRKPFDGEFAKTQLFGAGYRSGGRWYKHKGIDWALRLSTPVLSADKGIVVVVFTEDTTKGYGKHVLVEHEGCLTLYGHLSQVQVKVRQRVQRGEQIGASGRSGNVRGVTGYHLHFEVRIKGVRVDPLLHIGEKNEEVVYVPEPTNKLKPVYRLFNPDKNDHFYTTSQKEVKHAVEQGGYKNEGLLGYVYGAQKEVKV